MKKFYVLLFAVCILLGTACQQGGQSRQEPINLQLRLDTGDRFSYNILTGNQVNQTIRGTETEMKSDLQLQYSFRMKERTPLSLSALTQINKIEVKVDDGTQEVSYRSGDSAANQTAVQAELHRLFGTLQNKEFLTIFDTLGNVRQMQGLADLIKNAQGLAAAGIDDQTLGQQFSQAVNIYPGKPVKPGSTWQGEDTIQLQGLNLRSVKTFTLKKIDNGIAFVKMNVEYAQVSGEPIDHRITMKAEGSQHGTFEINAANGLINKAVLNSQMNITVSGSGQTVPIKITQSTTIEGRRD